VNSVPSSAWETPHPCFIEWWCSLLHIYKDIKRSEEVWKGTENEKEPDVIPCYFGPSARSPSRPLISLCLRYLAPGAIITVRVHALIVLLWWEILLGISMFYYWWTQRLILVWQKSSRPGSAFGTRIQFSCTKAVGGRIIKSYS